MKPVFSYFIGVLFVLLFSPYNTTASSKLEKAFKALEENDTYEAQSLFNSILETNRNDAGANFGLSKLHFKTYIGIIESSNYGTQKQYLFKSYDHLLMAIHSIDATPEKELKVYEKLNINKDQFFILKSNIETIIFSQISSDKDTSSLHDAIDYYNKEPLTDAYKELKSRYQKTVFTGILKNRNNTDKTRYKAFKNYITQFPDSKYSSIAQFKCDSFDYFSCKALVNLKKLDEFISSNSNNHFLSEAKQYREYLFYLDFTKDNTTDVFEKYISQYPDSRYIDLAKTNLKQLQDCIAKGIPEFADFKGQQVSASFASVNGDLNVFKVVYDRTNNNIQPTIKNYVSKTGKDMEETKGSSGSIEAFRIVKGNSFILQNNNKSVIAIQTRMSSYDNKSYLFFKKYDVEHFKSTSSTVSGIEFNNTELNLISTSKFSLDELITPILKSTCINCTTLQSAIKLTNNKVALLFKVEDNGWSKLNDSLAFVYRDKAYGFGELHQNEYKYLNNIQPIYKVVVLDEGLTKILDQKVYFGSIISMYPSVDNGIYLLQNIAGKEIGIREVFSHTITKTENYTESKLVKHQDQTYYSQPTQVTKASHEIDPNFKVINSGISVIKLNDVLAKQWITTISERTDTKITADKLVDLKQKGDEVFILNYTYKYGVLNYPCMSVCKLVNGQVIERYTRIEDHKFNAFDSDTYSIYKQPEKAEQSLSIFNSELYINFKPNTRPTRSKMVLQNGKIEF